MGTITREENTVKIVADVIPVANNTARLHRLSLTAPAAAAANGVMAARLEAAVFLAKLYSFTVTSANATAGAIYSDANNNQWKVVATIAGSTTLVLTAASGTPPASGTLTKVSGTGDATITFSSPGSNLITQPATPRILTITGTSSDHDAAGNVVIIGTNVRGETITDTITLNSNTTVAGIKAFKTITSIDFSAVTALDSTALVEVGTGAAFGLTRKMDSNGVFLATVDGAADSALPTVTYSSTDLSQNTVIPATTPNGSHNYIFTYATNETYPNS